MTFVEMKIVSSILIFLAVSMEVQGGHEAAISQLDADLVPIYERLVTQEQPTDLVGMHLELSLNLKHASDRYLLFTDTQIAVDEVTKYYLIKWKFEPSDVRDLFGKSNVICKVKGRIVDVVKGATSPGMPYIIVELTSVEF